MITPHVHVAIVGAGPAGLTAAWEAQSRNLSTIVLEQDPDYVGGISRTVCHNGYRFDVGGHRFFSKNATVTQWWKDRLPGDFIRVNRKSRIYYRKKYFDYPLKPLNALVNLGFWTSAGCVVSYAWARIRPVKPERSFEDWVSNRFGRRLFRMFFKTYTEKVWGVTTQELSADWAAQRIKGLSLSKAILNAFRGKPRGDGAAIKTLTDHFDYPRLGPGQMWETVAAEIGAKGGRVELGWKVVKIRHAGGRVTALEAVAPGGERRVVEAEHFIVSMPLQETILAFDPPLAPAVQAAAGKLGYRDFITVALVVEGENPFPDNWIYVHEPGVKMGRIQNFKNWSEAMIGRSDTTCLGLEYFCFAGDELWAKSDAELIELGRQELASTGIVAAERIREGRVVRMEKAYPIYDSVYAANVGLLRDALAKFSNLQPVGRNGMHKYNNQDHSMMTAMLAVRNLQGEQYDLWKVNTDAEYHEEGVEEKPTTPYAR